MERFVSTCFYRFGKQFIFQRNPSAYMKLLFQSKKELDQLLFLPQSHFIEDGKGESELDFTGDFSHLQQDFTELSKRFGWQESKLEKVNTSKHHPYSEYYDQELMILVREYYSRDRAFYEKLTRRNL